MIFVAIVACANSVSADDCMVANHASRQWVQRLNAFRNTSRLCGEIHYPAAKPVVWSDQLALQAQRQSLSMANMHKVGHTDEQGLNLGQHLARAGYRWRLQGEVVAAGYRDIEAVMLGWAESPAHCAVLMTQGLTEMGAACSNAADMYGFYWSLEVAAPKE